MNGYAIAAYNDNGGLQGYYTGATELTEQDLNKASFIADRGQARAGMSNLMRISGDLDLRLVPVKLSIELVKESVS